MAAEQASESMADMQRGEFRKVGTYFKDVFKVLRVLRFNMVLGKNLVLPVWEGAEALHSMFYGHNKGS